MVLQVLCCVVQEELEEEVVVRVLDCDSISQVKAKILDAVYKNTPFSLRPTVDEVDLEWRCGQYSQLGTPGNDDILRHEGMKAVYIRRHLGKCMGVVWIRIQIGSVPVFSNFVDLDFQKFFFYPFFS